MGLTKEQKEALAKDPFFYPWRRSPETYDWKGEFAKIAWQANKSIASIELAMELPVLLGLATYTRDLESSKQKLELEITLLREAVLKLLENVPKKKAGLLTQQYRGITAALDWQRGKMFEIEIPAAIDPDEEED